MKKKAAVLFSIIIFSNLMFSAPGAGGPSGGPSGGPGMGSGGAPGMGNSAPHAPPPPPSVPPAVPGGGFGSGSSSSPVIINYRGQRKLRSDEPLEILSTSIVLRGNCIHFIIHFNQAVDPAKINADSVIFNGNKIGSDVIIKFNRKSDAVTIVFGTSFYSEEEIRNSSLVLKNVHTFDGKFIEELKAK